MSKTKSAMKKVSKNGPTNDFNTKAWSFFTGGILRYKNTLSLENCDEVYGVIIPG
jgi:hypothetical protein